MPGPHLTSKRLNKLIEFLPEPLILQVSNDKISYCVSNKAFRGLDQETREDVYRAHDSIFDEHIESIEEQNN